MQTVNVREARQRIGQLLDRVACGEEVVILRRGRPVAKLTQIKAEDDVLLRFEDQTEFRRQFPKSKIPSQDLIRRLRDERY